MKIGSVLKTFVALSKTVFFCQETTDVMIRKYNPSIKSKLVSKLEARKIFQLFWKFLYISMREGMAH